jgi:HSP20 family molecular chaperone IbpA
MKAVGNGHRLPAHANVRTRDDEYVVELDVADFTAPEITVEALGFQLTVRGDQLEADGDNGTPFRLHETLEETFRLPDDVDAERLKAVYSHGILEIHAPRTPLEPRRLAIEHPPRFALNPDAKPC